MLDAAAPAQDARQAVLRVALPAHVRVHITDDAIRLLTGLDRAARLGRTAQAEAMLRALQDAPLATADLSAEDQLLLHQLEARGMLASSWWVGDRRLLCFEPIGAMGSRIPATAQGKLRLSPMAMLRPTATGFALLAADGAARLLLDTPLPDGLLDALAQGCDLPTLVVLGLPMPVARDLLRWGIAARVLTPPDTEPQPGWEFHDMLFHHWSNVGFLDLPAAATYRHLATHPAPWAPAPRDPAALPLPPPLPLPPISLADAAAQRRSSRDPGRKALTPERLSGLLHHIAAHNGSISGTLPDGTTRSLPTRPVPSGGAAQAVDVHVLPRSIAGLAPRVHRYDGAHHALVPLGHAQPAVDDGMGWMTIALVARFWRAQWKYERIAYRLMMLEAGALIQQTCLVGNAYGLSVCPWGALDARQFAEASGLDPWREGLLGGLFVWGART